MFSSQYFRFPLSVQFHHCSILIHSPTTHTILYIHPTTSVSPCQYHSTIAPYTFIPLEPTLNYNFLPVFQFRPVSTIPPLLHSHSFTYNPHYIRFSSQYFNFTLSVPFHHFTMPIFTYHTHYTMFSSQYFTFLCLYIPQSLLTHLHLQPTLSNVFLPVLQFSSVSSIPQLLHTHLHLPRTLHNIFLPVLLFPPLSTIPTLLHTHLQLPTTLYNVFLQVFPFPPLRTISPMLHSHSFTYHPHYIIFYPQYFSFPLSVPFLLFSIHIHSTSNQLI